jgi:DNA-binding CsgD family transcriptional regulator
MLDSATRLSGLRGDFDEAMDYAAELWRLDRRTQSDLDRITLRDAIAQALIEKGDHKEAAAVMSEVPGLLPRVSEQQELGQSLVVLSLTQLKLDRLDEAAHWAHEARNYLRFNLTWKQAVNRLDAQIALAEANPTKALSLVGPWLDAPGQIPLEQACMNELAAQAHWELGHRDEGLKSANVALTGYRQLSAVPRATVVEQWVASHTLRARGRPPSTAPGELTERERQITDLVAAGKTNREIAAALSISPGTVKKHVENIKSKVGVSRRTALARIASQGRIGSETPTEDH